ncbi:hypothetical protein BN903_21 [Halorubrum sp. AJ67]|nr:hypothetical protein BN903_21 [Halorubrum sp. AJ67]
MLQTSSSISEGLYRELPTCVATLYRWYSIVWIRVSIIGLYREQFTLQFKCFNPQQRFGTDGLLIALNFMNCR